MFDREVVVGMLSYGGTSADEPHIAIFSNISYFSRYIKLASYQNNVAMCYSLIYESKPF